MFSLRFCRLALLASLALPCSLLASNTPPVTTGNIPDATLNKGASPEVVDLGKFFNDPDSTGVRLSTSLGTVDIGLLNKSAPLTVANFLKYVDNGRYKITDPITGLPAPIFFHRLVPDFILQTGGFLATQSPDNPDAVRPTAVVLYDSVKNEPGVSNTRGTIAAAKLSNAPDSATSQWFFNLVDNSATLDTQNGGFTVFGKVLGKGMDVVDTIADLTPFNLGSPFDMLPLRDYTTMDYADGKPVGPENLVTIPTITRIPALNYTAVSDHPGIAAVSVSGSNVLVSPLNTGSATITVTATDLDGASVSQSFVATVQTAPPHLANISTRVVVGNDDDSLIGGFLVVGTTPKLVAVRAIGPSLADAGITNPLKDPTLELHDGAGNVIASNNNWGDSPDRQAIEDYGLAPKSPNESVLIASLSAKSTGSVYTAVIHGADGSGGTGLVEVYDLDSGPGSSVANLSTRGEVKPGDDIMDAGLIVGGTGTQRLLVRALGPTLTGAGVSGPLLNPNLTLYNAHGDQIDFNDDWMSNPNADEISATGVAPKDPRESAVIDTLAPGVYTAIVRGAGTSSGIALVEIYTLAP